MPIYEYECDKCGHEFEREQRMSDAPVKTCPKCKGRKVTKLISRSSFVLKGGGWYADGYSDAKKGSKDKDSSSGSDSTGESSSESSSSDDSTTSSPSDSSSDSKPKKGKDSSKSKGSKKKSAA
jgi:putative FmdB family regulatory protein